MEQKENASVKSTYKVWFFAGAETRDDNFNIFTGSFINMLKEIFGEDFDYIKGIFYRSNISNVIWALNNAQKPLSEPDNNPFTSLSFMQITGKGHNKENQLIITSSSSGSIVAAQAACYLAEKNREKDYFLKPFHLVLGASMIDTRSVLYNKLLDYQKEGLIGTILHDEIQDEGDNTHGVGGRTRFEAYRNALAVSFPFLTGRFSETSFLNSHPENGHLHRKRSMTVKKALDYIEIILVKNKLAGEEYSIRAKELLKKNGITLS